MIAANQVNTVSPHVARRSRTMKVRTLSPFAFEVSPAETGKLKRHVHFDLQESGVVKIECFAPETGECCEANSFAKPCSHVFAAVTRLLRNAKRAGTVEKKDAKKHRTVQQYARQVVKERLPGMAP